MGTIEEEELKLCWNDFPSSITSSLQHLRLDKDFLDVTLTCVTNSEAEQFRAHKVVLSACSSFFLQVLRRNPCKNPVIILWDVSTDDLKNVLNFMYNGEVRVKQENLQSFLCAAERLKVRGLCHQTNFEKIKNVTDISKLSVSNSVSQPQSRPETTNQDLSGPLPRRASHGSYCDNSVNSINESCKLVRRSFSGEFSNSNRAKTNSNQSEYFQNSSKNKLDGTKFESHNRGSRSGISNSNSDHEGFFYSNVMWHRGNSYAPANNTGSYSSPERPSLKSEPPEHDEFETSKGTSQNVDEIRGDKNVKLSNADYGTQCHPYTDMEDFRGHSSGSFSEQSVSGGSQIQSHNSLQLGGVNGANLHFETGCGGFRHRTTFSVYQVDILEQQYLRNPYIDRETRLGVSARLNLSVSITVTRESR